MPLAELEVYHSRPIAPTRRVAIGERDLPVSPAPGFGGLLLGGIVAAKMPGLDPDLFDDLDRLTHQLEAGMRIPQPRLRHRLQVDRVGLQRSVHRLHGEGEELRFEIEEDRGAPAHHILAAVYAAGDLEYGPRAVVMATIRKAMRWSGEVDNALVAHLSGLATHQEWSRLAYQDPVGWAMAVLALQAGCDVLLMPNGLAEAYDAVLTAVRDGTLPTARLDASVRKILQYKVQYGILLLDAVG